VKRSGAAPDAPAPTVTPRSLFVAEREQLPVGHQYTRRQVLGFVGASATWAVLQRARLRLPLPPAPGWSENTSSPPVTNPIVGPPQVSFAASAFRREDMLALEFSGYNLVLDTSGGQAVLRRAGGGDAYLVVGFPPQAVLEAAVPVGSTPPATWPNPPLPALLAGPSRLAFSLPPSVEAIPFTLEALLDWAALSLQVEVSPLEVTGAEPPALVTYIEAPALLFLSPDSSASWSHSPVPVTYSGRTELWQTRLGAGGVEPPAALPALRAVWTPGYPNSSPEPFVPAYAPSLSNFDRLDIIALTCGTKGSTTGLAYLPALPSVPAKAALFMLTPLGATMDVHGGWDGVAGTLTDWLHRMVTGRESYVRTVRAGYLFPFGHRAVHIKVTDREFQVDAAGEVLAYLVQREYVVVVQASRDYSGSAAEPFDGRQNPLRQVTVTTLATPPLDFSGSGYVVPGFGPPGSDGEVFWVQVDGADFPFGHACTDLEGRPFQFKAGAIFVSEQVALQGYNGSGPVAAAQQIAAAYRSVDPARRTPVTGGQLLAFADPGSEPGSTAQHVASLELGGTSPGGTLGPLEPPFFPVVAAASVHLPSAEQLSGTALGAVAVTISPNYYEDNFKAGVPEVFLELASGSAPVQLTFPGQASGGVATPNMGITGLARDLGPVAGNVGDLLAGKFDPKDFFPKVGGLLEAKLLGGLSLADILASVGLPTSKVGASVGGQAPQIKTVPVYSGGTTGQQPPALQAPSAFKTTLDWSPKLTGDPAGFFVPGPRSFLAVHAVIYTPIDHPSETSYKVSGQLNDFDLVLFGSAAPVVDLSFKGLSFSFASGAKAQLNPVITGVTFSGPLSFVSEFEQFFSSLGGPAVNVSASGAQASYSLALPSVSLGVFSLSNLALASTLNIPFDGSPVRLRFNLSTREHPFLLAIDLFTGGGFFGLALGADGIEMVEASLEFGASTSINLGVASGGVQVMAGIYLALQMVPTKGTNLTGFLRAGGNLSVLGIVSISVEFYLGLTYLEPGQAYGKATVTVTVSVLCFSKSVSMTMEKTIGGSDPSFAAAISQRDWEDYCLAFAS
jgi:hypothetical protein